MNILFTFEDQVQLERAAYLINWMIYKKYNVHVFCAVEVLSYVRDRILIPIDSVIVDFQNYDIWIYSIRGDLDRKKCLYFNELSRFKNKMFMLSLDDNTELYDYKVSAEILDKTTCYFGNVWYKYKNITKLLTEDQELKFRLLPSFHESSNFKEYNNIQSIPYIGKKNSLSFVGTITGKIPVQDLRITTVVKILREWKHPWVMKITGHGEDPVNTYYYNSYFKNDPDVGPKLIGSNMPFEAYINIINENKFSLCPKGNSPHITYRFFESLKLKTLVFMNEIPGDVEFYYPPIPNKHYISYRLDCSDLIDKLEYFYKRPDEAIKIVDEGFKYWEHFKFEPNGKVSDELDVYLTENFNI